MRTNRRRFSGSLIASGLFGADTQDLISGDAVIRAVAFDGFAVLDPRPVFALAENLFPGRGAELSAAWRIRQFEYTWLRTLSRRYVDFWRVTEDALVFAAKMLQLGMTANQRVRLMDAYLAIRCWPEAPSALRAIRNAGARLAFLSNMTEEMLEAGIRNSGLEGFFEQVLSTDRVSAFKPDPRAYQMGIDAFGLRREEIAFAAFAGWDAAGAKAFGFPTFWMNRQNQPGEELGLAPDRTGKTLDDLVQYLRRNLSS